MKKKIFVNGRFLTQRIAGVNRFAYELTKQLYKSGIEPIVICPKEGIKDDYDISLFKITKFGIGSSHIWEIFILPFYFIRKRNSIVISFTGAGHIWGPKKIVTIHDLAFKQNPLWYSCQYRILYNLLTPIAIKTSLKILTVSEFSKKEIMNYYHVKEDKIHVIYNACNENWSNVVKYEDNSKEDYFLCVSSLDPRKNFPTLINVFKQLPNERLKIVGSYNRVFGNTKLEELGNVELLGRVSDSDLAILYKKAKGFIYPSLYEGFGLPPLESMHFGCPVLVSNIPPLREVCADAAVYFDPLNPESICESVKYISKLKENERKVLINRGYKNVSTRFSWAISAKKLIDILESI